MAIPATSKGFFFQHAVIEALMTVTNNCFVVVPPIIMQSLERNFAVVKVSN